MGTTAHIYDDFAPKLAHGFHVWGITRRGFGASSQPGSGYDPTTLAADVLHVLDVLEVQRACLVGHSLAGEEITEIAANHPERVDKVVYLDAAYDLSKFLEFMQENPWPHLDPPTPADQATPSAMLDWEERAFGYRRPEADLRATTVFGPHGYERDVTEDSSPVFRSIIAGFKKEPYDKVQAPALAIFAVPTGAADLFPHRYASMDTASQAAARKMAEATAQRAETASRQFLQSVAHGQVLKILGASHYVFLSNEKHVLGAVRDFLRPAEGQVLGRDGLAPESQGHGSDDRVLGDHAVGVRHVDRAKSTGKAHGSS
jgi:pimeloyl-ACP methyl ester carboxylesterase